MTVTWFLNGISGISLLGVGIAYWQVRRRAQESQHKQGLTILRQTLTQTQDQLEQRLGQMTQQ